MSAGEVASQSSEGPAGQATQPRPLFSIVLPVYETPPDLLRTAIASVVDQTFPDWELLVIDDGSRSTGVTDVLDAVSDGRVRIQRTPTNRGIVAASSQALAQAQGEWVTFLDHDDFLASQALEVCQRHLLDEPECDFLYTDEEWVDLDGRTLSEFRKPDWSPERLRSQQYVNHLAVYRRELLERIGGMREGFDGSQDYDLVLRATEVARRIVHVPEPLYHWRVRPGQVSSTGNPKVYAAARRAIAEHCERVGIKATVEQVDPLGVYRVRRTLQEQPLVSIVIPTRGSSGTLAGVWKAFVTNAVQSIVERSSYQRLEFVVVADTVTPREVLEDLRKILDDRLTLLPYGRPFNFAHKINLGVARARGRYVLLLNDDVELITPDWIETLLGIGQQPDVGMVGATLLFENGTLQHAGHIYLGEMAIGHAAYGEDADSGGPGGGLLTERECSGVTAACALLRRDVFFEVGGLSRLFPANYNDVDLSLKLRNRGYRIVVTPHARLHHFESKTRTVGIGSSEFETIRRRWGRILQAGEPYWRYG